MGQFFTNVQLYSPQSITAADGEKLALIIRGLLISQGYEEVSALNQAEHRLVYIGYKEAGNWFTVLDSITEGQDPELLDQTARMLSSASNLTAISILVHDGDRLQMSLFNQGIKKDSIDTWPGYFNGDNPVVSHSDFSHWADVLPTSKTVDELKQAWELAEPGKGALPILHSISKTLELEDLFYQVGADSLPITLQPFFLSLRFYQPTQSDHDKPAPSPLPSFGHAGGLESMLQLGVNEIKPIALVAHSSGGAATGVNFTIWGSALHDGLVQISDVQISIGDTEKISSIAFQMKEIASTHGRMLSATLPDLLLPSGFPGPDKAIQQARGDFKNGLSAWLSSRININFQLNPLAVGKGELHLSLHALANEDGLAYWNTYLHVTAP